MDDLSSKSIWQLLDLMVRCELELLSREGFNSSNLVGDVGEHLACTGLGLTREPPITKGYDATDADGQRYQIKTRRIAPFTRRRSRGPA